MFYHNPLMSKLIDHLSFVNTVNSCNSSRLRLQLRKLTEDGAVGHSSVNVNNMQQDISVSNLSKIILQT